MKSRVFRGAAPAILSLAVALPAFGQSVLLRLNPDEGLESRYVTHMVTNMDSPMMSSDKPFMVVTAYTTQTVIGVEGEVIEYSILTDSTDVSSPAMPMIAQQVPDQTGDVQTLKMDTRGRMVDLTVEGASPEVQQALGQLGGLGLQLPEEPVSSGDSWTANIETGAPSLPGGGAMDMEMNMTYTLVEVASAGGSQFATITFEGPVVMSAAGGGMGMDASGTSSGTLVFDVTLGRIASSDFEMAMDVNTAGMQMSMTQSMTMTLIN
ncbi:MAG: DUF6263 family protein [Gemmatimonadota bacterium]